MPDLERFFRGVELECLPNPELSRARHAGQDQARWQVVKVWGLLVALALMVALAGGCNNPPGSSQPHKVKILWVTREVGQYFTVLEAQDTGARFRWEGAWGQTGDVFVAYYHFGGWGAYPDWRPTP